MSEAFIWWLTIELLGLAALPLALIVLRPLPDRGWAFAKILGLLLVGFLAWLVGMLQLAPFSRLLNAAALLALTAVSAWLLLRRGRSLWRELVAFCSTHLAYILVVELVFALAFAAWTILRAFDANIYGTEKFMDFAFLNSIVRGQHLPPQDPWLVGYPINYYYFGYSLVSTLCQLSGVDTAIGFNLANSSLFAFTFLGAFDLVYNLAQWSREPGAGSRGTESPISSTSPVTKSPTTNNRQPPTDNAPPAPGSRLPSYAAGLLGAVFVAVAGNLAGAGQVLGGNVTGDNFDWWSPSRVIKDVGAPTPETINEFPSFSFILGDLHPHVMALPLTLLVLALAFALLLRGMNSINQLDTRLNFTALFSASRVDAGIVLFVTALAVGSLYAANTWDFPTYLLVLLVALALPLLRFGRVAWDQRLARNAPGEKSSFREYLNYWRASRAGAWATQALPLIILSLLLFLPFQLTFTSQAGASGLPLPPAILDIPILGVVLHKLIDLLGINIWQKSWVGFVVIFGVFLYPISAMLVVMLVRQLANGLSKWSALRAPIAFSMLFVMVGGLLAIPLFALLGPLFVLCVWVLWKRLRAVESSAAELFVLNLIALGALISLGAELFFLQDPFHSRMNTLFKFYYQVWIFWALGGAFAVLWLLRLLFSNFKRRIAASLSGMALNGAGLLWAVGMAALLALALVYVAYAPVAKGGINWLPFVSASPHTLKGLDGITYVGDSAPGDLAAILWLRANAPATAGIAEAPGPEYNVRGLQGRVSSFTGMPTIIGWLGHEQQWRAGQSDLYASLPQRVADLNLLYSTTDNATAQAIMQKYGVSYVFVGTIEKWEQGKTDAGTPLDYGRAALVKFAGFMTPVFRSDPASSDPLTGTTVYKLR